MSDEDFQVLFQKYIDETMTPEEFRQWRTILLDEANTEKLDNMLSALAATDQSEYGKDFRMPAKRRLMPQRIWWTAAAAVAALAVIFLWPKQDHPKQLVVYDAKPAGNKAILKLADGSEITLDSSSKREIHQGNTTAQQVHGQLNYKGTDDVGINTLTTPRGGQFQVVLPDGTKVWLNAASSLSYPTAFTGKEREVEISGEAYFEVARDEQKPFRVKINQQNYIDVLGTHFNVNAYPDEDAIRSTLLEGRIKFTAKQSVVLNPGQQASSQEGTVKVLNAVDTSAVMAWRNGLFNFEGQHLKEVMRQLSRWYNIDVIYEQDVPDVVFGGKILRNISLTQLLRILEDADIHFRLEKGGKLIIQPK
jgi:ferric-dicitrate binding protein FerR (iron transport regulator)